MNRLNIFWKNKAVEDTNESDKNMPILPPWYTQKPDKVDRQQIGKFVDLITEHYGQQRKSDYVPNADGNVLLGKFSDYYMLASCSSNNSGSNNSSDVMLKTIALIMLDQTPKETTTTVVERVVVQDPIVQSMTEVYKP